MEFAWHTKGETKWIDPQQMIKQRGATTLQLQKSKHSIN
jgi:hypothetical protein